MRIAVTGGSGLVGSRIIELLHGDFEFIELSHREMDITDRDNVHHALRDLDYDLLLHLASYTNVDGAQKEPELAYRMNVEGTRHLFEVARSGNKKFVYISTDFVFDGTKPPYFEDSPTNPLGVYAKSKHEGERIVGNDGMVVRISYPYRASFAKKMDFVRVIRQRLAESQPVQGIRDSAFTPTFIDDIAFGLKHLMQNYTPEVFHLVGSLTLSPFEANVAIAKRFGYSAGLVVPVSFADFFKGRAPRPQYSEIRSNKVNLPPMKSFVEGLDSIV